MSTKTQKAVRAFFRQYQESYPFTARIEHYKKEARKYMRAHKIGKGLTEIPPCRWVLIHADEAIAAAGRGDFDHFAQAFERVIRESINSELPAFVQKVKAAGVSQSQSLRAQKPRKPRLRTRAVLSAVVNGNNTANKAEAYLNNTREISDTWGELDIEASGRRFTITEWNRKDGTVRKANLKVSDIPTVLTAAKKLALSLAG